MKVLFIGNSHTYFNEMPKTVEYIAKRCGFPLQAVMLTEGGMSLCWHAQQEKTRQILQSEPFDRAVLQNCAHPFDGVDDLRSGVNALLPMLTPLQIAPVLYMTWASLKHPEVQAEMAEAYQTVGREIQAPVAPVGLVWQRLREETDIPLFYTDGEHASAYGSYVAACVIFCTLTAREACLPEITAAECAALGVEASLCNRIHQTVCAVLAAQTNP